MRHPILSLASAGLITLSASRAVSAQQVGASRPSVIDSLSAQLVELELQGVSPGAGGDTQTKPNRDIISRIATVHERLRALPDGVAADREANGRVLLALDARGASVQARIHDARQVYLDAHPTIRQLLSEQRAISERRSEIGRTT